MATLDIRGASLSLADPPITTNPNADLAIKAPVRVATTGSNITLSGLQTIDGITLAAGDRVLVKDQTDQTTNGLYNATTGPWTRTIDANNNSQWTQGLQVFATQGTVNADTAWFLTTANPVILGTSLIAFSPEPALGTMPANTIKGNPTGSTGAVQNVKFGIITGGTQGQIVVKNSATTGDESWYDNIWLNIETFGGKGDNTTDNTTPFNNALAALTGTGGGIYFPPGKYRFGSAISFNYPSGIFNVTLVGSGGDSTILFWPSAGGGLTLNLFGLASSARVSDLSFTTGAAGGGTALTLASTFANTNGADTAVSNIERVTFRGDDGFAVTDVWTTCIAITNVSNVNFDSCDLNGASSSAGTGVSLIGLPASLTYAVQFNFAKCNFYNLAIGIQYGSYVQGVSISDTNFVAVVGNAVGILVPTSQTGTLDELAITGSQFNCSIAGVALNTATAHVSVSNSLFFCVISGGVALACGNANSFVISGNEFFATTITGTVGIQVNASTGCVIGNVVVGFGTGIGMGTSCSNIVVQGNSLGNANTVPLLETTVGANCMVVDNPGYNPQGMATITVTASPFIYQAGESRETVYVSAGTVSAIAVDTIGTGTFATNTGLTSGSFPLGPNNAIKVTYTGLPTMVTMRH